jgi:hypothetical protein
VFFVNLPIGAAILLLARRYLPAPTAAERRPQALDPLGVLLLAATVAAFLVPFIEQRTWDSPLRVALFPLGAVLLVVWVLHERRYAHTREPLVSLDLFRIRSYALGAPVGLLYFAAFVGLFFMITQYLQLGLHYPAWKSGLSATPFAIGGALVASASSRQALRRAPSSWPSGSPRSSSGWPASGWPSAPTPATTSPCGRRCRSSSPGSAAGS